MKALGKKGFRPVRQRGSHIIVENPKGKFAVVPRRDEIKPGIRCPYRSRQGSLGKSS